MLVLGLYTLRKEFEYYSRKIILLITTDSQTYEKLSNRNIENLDILPSLPLFNLRTE